jgi:hypothetical protein
MTSRGGRCARAHLTSPRGRINFALLSIFNHALPDQSCQHADDARHHSDVTAAKNPARDGPSSDLRAPAATGEGYEPRTQARRALPRSALRSQGSGQRDLGIAILAGDQSRESPSERRPHDAHFENNLPSLGHSKRYDLGQRVYSSPLLLLLQHRQAARPRTHRCFVRLNNTDSDDLVQ